MKGKIAALLDRIRGSGSRDDADIVKRSCLERAGEPPAIDAPPIALSYAIDIKNIGDLISPVAVQYATERPTVWRPPAAGEHLLAVGSILHWATPLSHVWGSGLQPTLGIGELEGEHIWALRGKLTHSLLQPEVSGLRDVPLGDPAYLVARRLAPLMPARSPTHRLGLVPHVEDRNHPGIAHLRGQDGVLVLDVRDPAPKFFARMMECETIAGSSLHGLVFAEALGIPNVWVDFRPEDPDRAFAFQDWFSLADKPGNMPLRVDAAPSAGDLIAAAALHDMKIDERALRGAVPQPVLDELSLSRKKAPRIVHMLNCRRRPMPIFLTCGDLGARLQAIAASYRTQSVPTELVLIDGGAGGEKAQGAIGRLQQDGALVRVIDPGTPEQQAQSLQHVIRDYFKRWGEPQRYAIASGAVDFSTTSAEAFALYDELLDRFPDVEAVGPMLRVQELPRTHPALGHEIAAHWSREPIWCDTSLGHIAVVRSSLFGNFALCRAGVGHLPPKSGLRVHHPFDAHALDWPKPRTTEPPAHPFYYDVERRPDGTLAAVTRPLWSSRRLHW
ncbi:glycosyltransferase family protein [Dongia deserti]|uniref:polysaccharide pyruvyl transferase family protein n=1 Tax=Dongia deserti TaxID=2268030 RepID=UPI000E654255|nr:polysaccharide pyruvyl transferase family protein [Dongia deserti]